MQVLDGHGYYMMIAAGIESLYHKVLQKQRNHTDKRILLGHGIGGNICIQKLVVQIIAHVMVYLQKDILECIITHSRIDGRIDHGDKVSYGI